MQQEKRRLVFRAGFSVENGEPLYLYRAKKSRVFHGMVLSLGLSQQLKSRKDHRNKHCHAGNLRALDPMRHFENRHNSALLSEFAELPSWFCSALPLLLLGGVITPRRARATLSASMCCSISLNVFAVPFLWVLQYRPIRVCYFKLRFRNAWILLAISAP